MIKCCDWITSVNGTSIWTLPLCQDTMNLRIILCKVRNSSGDILFLTSSLLWKKAFRQVCSLKVLQVNRTCWEVNRAEHTKIFGEGKNICFTNPLQKAQFDSEANRHYMTYTNTTVSSKSKCFSTPFSFWLQLTISSWKSDDANIKWFPRAADTHQFLIFLGISELFLVCSATSAFLVSVRKHFVRDIQLTHKFSPTMTMIITVGILARISSGTQELSNNIP